MQAGGQGFESPHVHQYLSFPQTLVPMATGTGKSFTIVNQGYRLMNAGVALRILFLVDRRALLRFSLPPMRLGWQLGKSKAKRSGSLTGRSTNVFGT